LRINTGMGRPRKLNTIRQISISLYENYREVYGMAVELSRRENKSLSLIFSIALAEYVENHYPGNPQTPMESFTGGNRAKTLEAKGVAEDVQRCLNALNLGRGDTSYLKRVRESLSKYIVKLARLNRVLRLEEYDELIDEGDRLVYG